MAPYNGFGKRQPSDQPPVLTPTEKDALKVRAHEDGVKAQIGGRPTNGSTAAGAADVPAADAPTSEGAR